jgi:hypothetical protein
VAASDLQIPGKVGSRGSGGNRGNAIGLGRVLTGSKELALQIRLGDLYIAECHSNIFVTHQPDKDKQRLQRWDDEQGSGS